MQRQRVHFNYSTLRLLPAGETQHGVRQDTVRRILSGSARKRLPTKDPELQYPTHGEKEMLLHNQKKMQEVRKFAYCLQ